jgi:8-oxo-dGTP pyrophosphatase MutT (NUDIX family)
MAHIHELIDWTAGAYIVYKDKVLIRKHEKYGIWIHVGGHVELDEDPVACVIRECKEEVGLDVKVYKGEEAHEYGDRLHGRTLPLPAHMNIHWVNEIHQHLDLLYYCSSDSDEVIPENQDDEWVWLTTQEVTEHPEMSPQIKLYALGALETLGIKS